MPDTLTFTSGTELHGFVVESVEPLSEIDGTAIVMRHAQSGARLLFLRNEDENKAFSISFKTPPTDNTGVFHILEHSVLCGSDKFPVKEPFVNLLKTSMQTFLNALTFPDKTMYPVASTNGQDLLNLIDVYMDAVLHPAIYTKPEIFQQEGWHYELDGFAGEGDAEGAAGEANGEAWVGEDAEAVVTGEVAGGEVAALDEVEAQAAASALQPRAERLRYNGVVFNEMKGALSDPDSVLYRAVNAALFPDTCYACESGGDPRSIPQLTYEQFLDTHARHYRLDNSYMVLYGALDAEAVLGFLDERYLSAPDCAPRTQAAPDEIGTQEPLVACDVVVPMDTVAENACVGAGYVIGEAADFERVLACDVLLDALMGGNESPIKRAILDAGLGGDATAYLVDSQAQPVALFQLKNAFTHSGAGQVESIQDAAGQGEGAQDALAPEAASAPIDAVAQQFMALVESEVCALVQGGIPRDLLEASLSQMAFDLRERDRGMADGVPLAMNALAGWLYDDAMPTTYLRYEDALAHMRAGLETRYFEDVLERLILGSNHKALVEVRPQKNGAAAAEAAELEATRAGMSARDKQDVCRQVAALRAMQETPDTPEALAALPQAHVADIGPAMPDPAVELCAVTPLPCLFHNMPTRHIDYVYAYFGVDHLTWEDLPYVTLLTMLLTRLDTARHTAAEPRRAHAFALRFAALLRRRLRGRQRPFGHHAQNGACGQRAFRRIGARARNSPRGLGIYPVQRCGKGARHPGAAQNFHGAEFRRRRQRARHESRGVVPL